MVLLRETLVLALADCSVRAWGRGDEGQLGHGGFASVDEATCVANATACFVLADADACALDANLCNEKVRCIADVAAGGRHSVLLRATGTVLTFGAGHAGQLGHGARNYNQYDFPGVPAPNANLARPQQILYVGEDYPTDRTGLPDWWRANSAEWGTKVVQAVAGDAHTVLRMADGTVRTFGMGLYWQLGHYARAGAANAVGPATRSHVNVNIPTTVLYANGSSVRDVQRARAGTFDTTLLIGAPGAGAGAAGATEADLAATTRTVVLSLLAPATLALERDAVARDVTLPSPNLPPAVPPPSPAAAFAQPADTTNVVGNAPEAGCCDGFNRPLNGTPTGAYLWTRHYFPSNVERVTNDTVNDAALLLKWEQDPALGGTRLVPRFYCDPMWFFYDPTITAAHPEGRGRFRDGKLKGGFPGYDDARAPAYVASESPASAASWVPACPAGTPGAGGAGGAASGFVFAACKQGFVRSTVGLLRACVPTQAYIESLAPDVTIPKTS
eukprot:g7007.t1